MEISLIEAALKAGDISTDLKQDSPNKDLVKELQRILFELGFKSLKEGQSLAIEKIEVESKKDGKELEKMTLAEMDEYWDRAKKLEL